MLCIIQLTQFSTTPIDNKNLYNARICGLRLYIDHHISCKVYAELHGSSESPIECPLERDWWSEITDVGERKEIIAGIIDNVKTLVMGANGIYATSNIKSKNDKSGKDGIRNMSMAIDALIVIVNRCIQFFHGEHPD